MLGERLDTTSLVTFFTFMQCKLIIRNVYLLTLLTLSKSERVSNQGIYKSGIKAQVTTKDIQKED